MTERDQELAEMMQLDQQRRGTGDKHRDSIHIADLSPDAQEVLRRVVAKFRAGAAEHGPLSVTSRRWGPELLNEAIDALHYCIFELMRLEQTAETDVVSCTCIEDYLRGGGVLHPGAVIQMCNSCVLRHLDATELKQTPDDGLPLGGEWEALNAVK